MADLEAVVFDVGGVMCPSPITAFEAVDVEFGLPPRTVEGFIRSGGTIFAACEVGRTPISAFYAFCADAVLREHGVEIPHARLDAMFTQTMGTSMRPEMLDLVREIKAAGYRTGLLTNIFAERRQWLHTAFPPTMIDVYCDSSEVGMRKPDVEVYGHLCGMLGVRPEQVAFVDDFAENLVPAREMGMVGVLYDTSAQVRSELAASGVRIDEAAKTTEEVAR